MCTSQTCAKKLTMCICCRPYDLAIERIIEDISLKLIHYNDWDGDNPLPTFDCYWDNPMLIFDWNGYNPVPIFDCLIHLHYQTTHALIPNQDVII